MNPTHNTVEYIIHNSSLHIQGCLFATPECLKSPVDLVRLWLHEASRVYGDKLIETKDIAVFTKLKLEIAKASFEVLYTICYCTHQ